jgi:hypothetical protein
MHFVLCALWLGLAAGWLSGISVIANIIGGYRWIEHMGQSRTVTMLAAMGCLCLISAFAIILVRRLPKVASLAVAILLGLHFFNALGLYVLMSTNGRAGSALIPFMLVSTVLPTSTQFLGMPPGNASIFLLPGITLLVWLASLQLAPNSSSAIREA